MRQQRFAFPNRHGGNRKHNWAQKQKRKGKLCPVPHRRRCEVEERFPMHVTMRLREGLESLRQRQTYPVVCQALRNGKEYGEFRLHHWSVQSSRVGPGGWPPGPPTDPDVRDSRIRLFGVAGSLRAA